jgi:predicted Zn-dependent protease
MYPEKITYYYTRKEKNIRKKYSVRKPGSRRVLKSPAESVIMNDMEFLCAKVKTRVHAAFFILACMSLIIYGCATNPVTGERELMFLSESQEIEMGREFYPNALWGDVGGGGEFRDARLQSYLKDIILRIHSVSHRPNLPVDFAVQNSSIPNAWAIPGHVAITRGLLASLENEAEFAFVMGHEMGHVSARHSARQMTYSMLQQIGIGAAGLALSGTEYAELATNIGAVGSSLLLLKYSRSDELEADRLGIQYMARLGYNPDNAVSAHRRLEQVSREYAESIGRNSPEGGFFEELLSTHPRTSVRIEEIQRLRKEIPPVKYSGDGTGRERFLKMTDGLRQANSVYRKYYDKAVLMMKEDGKGDAESLIAKALSEDPYQAPFHALRGFIFLKGKDYPGAERNFRAALGRDDRYEPAYRGLGIVMYSKGEYSQSAEYLKKALSIYPNDVIAHYFLGMGGYRTQQYRSAIPHLLLFSEVQPEHPEIHGILGQCYESVRDISSAYNHYVMQVRVNPRNEMGRYASSRISVLKPMIKK